MLCGLTRIRSRIKLWIYVRKHSEWNCKGFCPICKYWDMCLVSKEAEEVKDAMDEKYEDYLKAVEKALAQEIAKTRREYK